jgi:trimeric autotransporter adhesin
MKKNHFCFFAFAMLLFIMQAHAQNVAINEDGSAPNPNAILDIKSFTKGILIPRLSTTGRLAIPNTKGLLVFDSTAGSFFFNTGTGWQNMTQPASAPGWLLTGNTGGINNFIGTIDNTPFQIRVNNQSSGLIDAIAGNVFWGNNAGAKSKPDSTIFNTSIGHFSMSGNTSGSFNTSGGSFSLQNNVSGNDNTAFGFNSLSSNNTGLGNTATGSSSLLSNTTGIINTAVGFKAMLSNTTGGGNTAIGFGAMRSNATGLNNTALGFNADVSSDNLVNATAVGANAKVNCSNCLVLGSKNDVDNSTSEVNVGIGTSNPNAVALLELNSTSKGLLIPRMTTAQRVAISNAPKGLLVFDSTAGSFFFNTGTAWQSLTTGTSTSTGWSLTGNSGIDASSQFIGTTDNQPLHFRINNIQAGELNPASGNVFWGKNAGQANTTGFSNIAIGTDALKMNTMAGNLVAIGDSALFHANGQIYNITPFTQGHFNTAIGSKSLFNNNVGESNTAIGYQSLFSNYSFSDNNTAVGSQSLFSNYSSDNNTAVGSRTLYLNTYGESNTAIGASALYNNIDGRDNTAIGLKALEQGNGSHNTALGSYALQYPGTSQNNVAIGYYAGYSTDGWNNTFIGANTRGPYSYFYNCVAIGESANCTSSNQVRLGNSYTTSIGGYAQWTNISDGRYKKNIKEDVKGIEFIMKLRPVTYQLDITGISKKLNEGGGKERDEFSKKSIAEKEKTVLTGFVAQEVEKAAKEAGYNFSGVDIPKNDNEFYGLRYSEFVVPLVKAVQEQQQTISSQNVKLEEQNKKMADLQKQIDELKQLIQHSK